MKFIAALMLIFFCASISLAQVPRTINYQGLLRSGNSVVADGDHTIVLSLYDSPFNGNLLFRESQKVNTVGGRFSCALGSVTLIHDSLEFNIEYFIGVAFDGNPEQSPRSSFTSAPYALHAAVAGGLSDNAFIPKNIISLYTLPGGPAGGDLLGYYPAPIVSQLRSQPFTNVLPNLYDKLRWDGKQWQVFHLQVPRTFLIHGDTALQIASGNSSIINFISDSTMFFEDSNFLKIPQSIFRTPETGAYEFIGELAINCSVSDSTKFAVFRAAISVNGTMMNPLVITRMQYKHTIVLEFTSAVKVKKSDDVRFIIQHVSGTGTFTLKSAELAGLKID